MNNLATQKSEDLSGRELLSQVRSAFAFQDDVLIFASDIVESVKGHIAAFEDFDLRDTKVDRKLELAYDSASQKLGFEKDQTVIFEIISGVKRLKFEALISETRKNSFIVKLPNKCEVIEVRSNSRFKLDEQDWADGLVTNLGHKFPVIFKIENISKSALGISLVSAKELPQPSVELVIESDIISENFHFLGPYHFARLSILTSSQGHYEYTAGLITHDLKDLSNESRAQRHAVQKNLQLLISATNTEINAKIIDVSTSGFIAQIAQQNMPGIAKDLIAKELSAGLKFRITRINTDQSVAFQLVTDSSNDQIKWLNIITPFVSSGRTQMSVTDHRSLLNLFFEAGASVVDGLKYKRFRLTQKDTLALFTAQSDVLLRWINISDAGTIQGHHSTYRIGLNSWYTGDVVGGQTENNRVDPTFFKNNFRILKETVECFQNTQKIVGSWKPNHPYWQEWRNFLINKKLSYCFASCDSATRDQILDLNFQSVEQIPMNSSVLNDRQLFGILGLLRTDYQWLLSTLDIHSTGNSSDGTNAIYLKSGYRHFRRCIRKLDLGSKSFLAIFSQLPNGISINPNFDSIFIFPLQDGELTKNERDNIYTSAISEGSRLGYKIASVRYFSEKCEILGTKMEFFVIDSEGLGIFE